MKIKFLGSGDAFGSGGKLQTCIYGNLENKNFLIDCGTTAMIGMRKFGIDPNSISHIFLTHLHGDHFGGIPFVLLDAQMISKRTNPLTIVGPVGAKERILSLMDVFFPGSSKVQQKFDWDIVELCAGEMYEWDFIQVCSFLGNHPSGADATALQFSWEDKKMVYTGDTEWVDSLEEAIRGVDLVIGEAYYYEKKIKFHLDYLTLVAKAKELGVKRLILTHMSSDMLGHLGEISCEAAEDGSEFIV